LDFIFKNLSFIIKLTAVNFALDAAFIVCDNQDSNQADGHGTKICIHS